MTLIPAYAQEQGDWVYFGSRSTEPGQGIVAARFDANSGKISPVGIVAEIAKPAWLLAHPKLPVLYSVSEVSGESRVYAFGIDRTTGKLTPINNVASNGAGATHLAFDEGAKALFVAHYGSGHVSWLPTADDGRLGIPNSVQSNYGSGPNQQRQAAPHAHGVAVDPSHRYVLAADLGADRVFVYGFDPATRQLTPAATPFATANPGSGPRHLTFHPNGKFLFLVTEMFSEVVSYHWDAKRARLQHIQTLLMDEPTFSGQKSAAHIATSQDGRYVYASNRGANTIAVFGVNSQDGTMRLVQRISSEGRTPWDFSIDHTGRWMLIANSGSNSIAVFAVNPETGELKPTQETLTVAMPSNVTFLPR
ncbi:MAG: lactonase family protein [Steroidobacter sp.]